MVMVFRAHDRRWPFHHHLIMFTLFNESVRAAWLDRVGKIDGHDLDDRFSADVSDRGECLFQDLKMITVTAQPVTAYPSSALEEPKELFISYKVLIYAHIFSASAPALRSSFPPAQSRADVMIPFMPSFP